MGRILGCKSTVWPLAALTYDPCSSEMESLFSNTTIRNNNGTNLPCLLWSISHADDQPLSSNGKIGSSIRPAGPSTRSLGELGAYRLKSFSSYFDTNIFV